MNFSDSEIIASILAEEGFGVTQNFSEADLILINTCSIRDKAEEKIRMRISELKIREAEQSQCAYRNYGLHG